MSVTYNVVIERLGRKKKDRFSLATICLNKDGTFLVMDSEGKKILFMAENGKVEEIAAEVIVVRGYTTTPCCSITAYCVYSSKAGA